MQTELALSEEEALELKCLRTVGTTEFGFWFNKFTNFQSRKMVEAMRQVRKENPELFKALAEEEKKKKWYQSLFPSKDAK